MGEVFRDLTSFETVDFKDVVIPVAINPNDDDTSEVTSDFSTVREIDGGKHIKTSALDEVIPVGSSEMAFLVILETFFGDTPAIWIVWIVIVLSPELYFIEVLCPLFRKSSLIETERFTISSKLAGP